MGRRPKEDPADKAARERERRISEIEQQTAAQKNAQGLSGDLASIYNFTNRKLSIFGKKPPAKK